MRLEDGVLHDLLLDLAMPQIQIDWRRYFADFCEQHGEPIVHKGMLLFADGWRYSMNNFAGPEFPPPADARVLEQLRDTYKSERRMLLQRQWTSLDSVVNQLKRLQANRSGFLARISHRDEHGNPNGHESIEVALEEMERRLAWLEDELQKLPQTNS
jgi:hypothetical protein